VTALDGIINLDKPVGITSAKALYHVRAILGQRKSGHAGTLDPGASGVLVLCLGRATKLVERVMDQPKVYRATARLDVTSESLDSDSPYVHVDASAIPSEESVHVACAAFVGMIEQAPPRISAVKIAGQPAYKIARRDPDLALPPRPVRVDWIHVHAYEWPYLDFEMCCGRGTYVRSVIRDVGARLGVGGCLTSLVRTRVGPFHRAEGVSLDRIDSAGDPEAFVLGLDRAIAALDPERIVVPPPPTVSGRVGDDRIA